MSEPQFPQAPEIRGEIILDVFTHSSLRQEGGGGDNERYAVLGEKVLEAVVTHCIFLRFPHYKRKEIEEERNKQLSDHNYEQWTNYYRLRDKLRYSGAAIEEINSIRGAREMFHAYIGGVYSQTNGPATANAWLYLLLVPPDERMKLEETMTLYHTPSPPPPSHPYPMAPPPPPPPPSHLRNDFYAPRSRKISSSSNVQMNLDEPLNPVAYSSSPASTIAYLPRFNEITTQRRMSVVYQADQTGLQHAPRWVIKCLVEGKEVGEGTATTKQLAKEEAAKQAFHALKLDRPRF